MAKRVTQTSGGLASSWFDSLAGTDWEEQPGKPFQLRMLVLGKEGSPRHEMFDWCLEFGTSFIEPALLGQPINSSYLLFVFPERHLSVHESRLLIHNLMRNPNVRNIKRVDVVTQNPFIVMQGWEGCLRMISPTDKITLANFKKAYEIAEQPEPKARRKRETPPASEELVPTEPPEVRGDLPRTPTRRPRRR